MLNKKVYKIIKSNIFFLLILMIIVFVLYGKSVNFKFTNHDDISLISSNINYLSQWKNIPSLFKTSVYISKYYLYYRPILSLTFSIEAILFYNNTKIYHITNILFFILALYLMYAFLLKLNLNQTILKLLIILFSVHPILTSSVVWIPARNDTLLAIFVFLSFIFFIKYLEDYKLKNLMLYILFWTMALFTKETALFVILLYCLFLYCFNYKLNKKNILINGCIFISILIVYFWLRGISVEVTNIYEHTTYLKDYFENVIYGCIFFVYKLFWFADMPIMINEYNINNNIFLYIYIILFFIFYFLYKKKFISSKILLFALIWFLVWLLPTFLFQKDKYMLLFHRIFIPLFAVILILCKILENNIIIKNRKIFTILYIVLCCILFKNSYIQANKYSTPELYFENSKKHVTHGSFIQNVIIQDYIYKGNLDEALNITKQVMKKYPDNISIKLNLAKIFYMQGKIQESIDLYKEISNVTKENKYICYKELSKIYMEQNEFDKAMFYGQQAYNLKPYNIEVSENLAIIYAKIGYYENAINILTYLLLFDKKNAQYMYNLSLLYEKSGNLNKSIEYAKLAVQQEPYHDEYRQYLQKLQRLINEENSI